MFRSLLAVLVFSCSLSAIASDEDALLKVLQTKFPITKINSVSKSPFPGMYEVAMGRNMGYTDAKGDLMLFGHIFDMKAQRDLTAERLAELNKVEWKDLPLQDAIKIVKGDGSREFAVFTDPDCPYCRALESEIDKLDNYTEYVFIVPLHPSARDKSKHTWCAENPVAVWRDMMVNNKTPTEKNCDAPMERNMSFASKIGVQGTPFMVSKTGVTQAGAMAGAQLNNWLSKGRM